MDVLAVVVPQITNEALTTKVVDGSGIFDIVMASINAHLMGQYESGRITGADFTKAYIELTTAALSSSVAFLLGRDEAYWKGLLAQQQVANAQQQNLLLKEQTEVQRAQTLNERTDGATVVGAIGKQKDLYTQQITSYQRDAEVKAAKMFIDSWITQKTLDEGLTAPTSLQNASIDVIMAKIKTNNSLT